jgi:hypothetical protein
MGLGSGFSGQDARCYGGRHRGRPSGERIQRAECPLLRGRTQGSADGGRIWRVASRGQGWSEMAGGEPGSHPEDLDAGDSRLLYKCSVVVAPGTSRPEATV